MSAFPAIFDATAEFLKGKGIAPEVSKGKKATPTDIKRFHTQTGILLPESFSAFYTGFADGFEFRWEKTEDQWGVFSIPSLKQLSEDRRSWERRVRRFLHDPDQLGGCVDPQFRPAAFKIWGRMESWVPFWDEGNGDHFCVVAASGLIVYDQHDWYDGFGTLAKTNGLLAGQSLVEFVQNWSQFCFRRNKSLWWGEFAKHGEIKWEPEFFDMEFFRGV